MTKPKDPQEPVFEDPLKVGERRLSYDQSLPELEMLKDLLARAEKLPMTKSNYALIQSTKWKIEWTETSEEFDAWESEWEAKGNKIPGGEGSDIEGWKKYLAQLEAQPLTRGMKHGIEMVQRIINMITEEAKENENVPKSDADDKDKV